MSVHPTRSLADSEAECNELEIVENVFLPASSGSISEPQNEGITFEYDDSKFDGVFGDEEESSDDDYSDPFQYEREEFEHQYQQQQAGKNLITETEPFFTDEEKETLREAREKLGPVKFMELLLESYVAAKIEEISYLDSVKPSEASALKTEREEEPMEVDCPIHGDDCLVGELTYVKPKTFMQILDEAYEDGSLVDSNIIGPKKQYQSDFVIQSSDSGNDVVPAPTTSGEANITFVDNRPIESDSTHTNSDISTTDQNNDMAELIWSAQKILTREILLQHGFWKAGQKEISSFPIPKCITDKVSSAMVSQLKLFGFLRAGVRFRIQLNGTKFHCGRLIAFIVPPQWVSDKDSYKPSNFVCFPHVFLDASQSNSAELFVPFVSILSHFPQRKDSLENDTICTLGRMVLYSFNDLRAADGASSELPYSVYAHFINPEIHQITFPIVDFSYGDGFVTQGKQKSGLEGGLKQALSGVASKVGGFAGGLVTGGLNTILDFVLDKPTAPLPAEPMVNKSINAPCHGAGIDHSTRLALTPISQTETTVDQMGTNDPDFNLQTLTKIPSLMKTFKWNGTTPVGTVMYQALVSPTFMTKEHFAEKGVGTMEITPTMLAYVSRAFVYWRGDIKMKIAVVSTQFHSGRLGVIYDPTWTYKTQGAKLHATLDEQMNHNMIVVDIEQAGEVEVDLPYMTIRPWLRCDNFRDEQAIDTIDIGANLGETCCGMVRIFVLQTLVNPSNVPSEIDVNVFVYAGDNFELAYPNSLHPLDVTREASATYGSDQEYPFVIGKTESPYYDNREYIIATYFEGKKLYLAGKLKKADNWWEADSTGKWGQDEQTVSWMYKATQLKRYITDATGSQQTALMKDLPKWSDSADTLIDIKKTVQQTENKLDNPVIPDLKGVAKGVETVLTEQSSIKDTLGAVNNRVYQLVNHAYTKEDAKKLEQNAQLAKDYATASNEKLINMRPVVDKTASTVGANNTRLINLKTVTDKTQQDIVEVHANTQVIPNIEQTISSTYNLVAGINKGQDQLIESQKKNFDEQRNKLVRIEDIGDVNNSVLQVVGKNIDKANSAISTIPKVDGAKYHVNSQFNGWGDFSYIYAGAPLKEEDEVEFITQSTMDNSTTRDNEVAAVVPTAGHMTSSVAPKTISENAMNIQTVLRRAYPWMNSGPIYGVTGYTLVTIPVNPTFTPLPRSAIADAFAPASPVTNLAWFSRLYTYWRGSLRYKFLFDAPVDAFVWHIPMESNKYNIMTGVEESDIQKHMAFAGTLAATRLQASIEVEVPFASPYTQCLIDVHRKIFDLRTQNGTLYLAFRTHSTHVLDPVKFTAFIAAGEDYVLNVLKAPPEIFQPQLLVSACEGSKEVKIPCSDVVVNMGNNSDKIVLPGGTGIKYLDPQGRLAKCVPLPGPEDTPYVTQALEDWIVSTETKEKYTSLLDNLTETTQTLHDISMRSKGIPDDLKATTENLKSLTESLKRLTAPASVIANKYIDISVQVTMLVVTMNEFKGLVKEFSFQNVMRFAMAFAGFLGYNFSESLKILLHGVVNYFVGEQLPQTQAIDGALADAIEGNEEMLVPVVAVIGTIIYAYIFDCIPSMNKVKSVVQEFFEGETKKENPMVTQSKSLSDGMRSMHFSVLGCKAVNTVFEKLCELIKRFLDWILERENPVVIAQRRAGEYQDRILDLIKKIDELESEENFITALSDGDVHNKFYLLMDEANSLMDIAVKQELDAKVSLLIKETRERMRKLIVRLEKEHPIAKFRYDPFVVCLHGETGTCKTEFMHEISKAIADELGLSEYNRIYNRTVTKDGFWNNYKNQPIVEWDEFGQNKETEGVIGGFIELRGNAPLQVPMASLDDKGRHFTSKAIVMTTNVPYERFATSIREPDAFLRRRHLMIGCQHKPGTTVHTLQTSETYNPNFDMIQYAETHNMKDDIITPGLSAEDVLNLVRQRVRSWNTKQEAIKQHVEQDPIKLMPRGIIPKVETVEEEIDEEQLALREEEFEDAIEFTTEAKECSCPRVRFVKVDVPDLTEEEELEQMLFLERMENSTCCEKSLFAKALTKTKTKVSQLFKIAKAYFDSLAAKVAAFFKENPKVMTIAGVLGLLGTAGVLLLTQEREKKETEAAHYGISPHLVGRSKVVTETHYDAGSKIVGKKVVVTEGCYDPSATPIARRLHNYMSEIGWVEGNKKSQLKCLQIGGSVILLPFHFFAGAKEGDLFEVAQRDIPVQIEYNKENMVRLEDKDWVLYDCGAPFASRKMSLSYFIKEADLNKIKRSPANLLMLSEGIQLMQQGEVEAVREFKYKDEKLGEVYKQTGWTTRFNTQPGDCGSIVVLENTTIPSPGKAAGIHVAGRPNSPEGFVVLVTYEMLKKAWDLIEQKRRQVIGMPIVEELTPDLTKCKVVPVGDYSLYGVLPNKLCPIQPVKTSFIQTPFYNEAKKITSPPKKPAHLRQFIDPKTGQTISPLAKALGKYGKSTRPFPLRNRKKVAKFLSHWIQETMTEHQGKRIFSEEEAILGIPGCPELQKLNMKSSAGWPYQVFNRAASGKHHLFSDDGKVIDAELRKRIDQRLDAAKRGERVPSLWRDCLKDELRPNEKVDEGKTRLFTIAPVDYTILVRRYFMDFVGSFYKAHLKFFSAVGINAESFEWTELYNKLAECGTKCVAGDFATFDGTLMADLIDLFCEIVNEWYGDGPEAEMIRKVLVNEIIHTFQLIENTVYATHKGNPSGNPLTVILNTIVNMFYMLLAWLEIYPEATLDEFRRFVRAFAYGDDNLLTVKDHPEYNQNSISKVLAKYGITYTAETKGSGPVPDYRELSTVTFLKRGFRKDPEYGNIFWLPTMNVDTLHSFWFYVRSSSDEVAQLQENMRAGLVFAAFHGKEFYNNYLKTWQKLMRSANYSSLQISFEEQVDVFRHSCGMSYGVSEENFEGFMKASNSKIGRAINGILASPLYYLSAATGIIATDRITPVEDDRWAVAIPSGEGKSTLCKKYPGLFVDHDDLLLPKFDMKSLIKGKLPWKSEIASELDFPKEDRRILLVHHPNNTKRRLIGSFITHYPTYIRINALQRLVLKNPIKMTRDERNAFLVQFAAENEPQLFGSSTPLPLPAGEMLTSNLNQLGVGTNATA